MKRMSEAMLPSAFRDDESDGVSPESRIACHNSSGVGLASMCGLEPQIRGSEQQTRRGNGFCPSLSYQTAILRAEKLCFLVVGCIVAVSTPDPRRSTWIQNEVVAGCAAFDGSGRLGLWPLRYC